MENVGELLLEIEEFSRYTGSGVSQSDNPFFFCDGDAGVGKTRLGSKDKPRGRGEKAQVSTSCDVSLLVIDSLYYQARGQNGAFACFYVDIAARRPRHDNRSGVVLYECEKGAQREI